MTVISAVISTHCIAVSSDSMLTIYNKTKNTSEIIEYRRPKIVRIEKFLGSFSYWGLAAKSKFSKWTMYGWLKIIANDSQKFSDFERYANYVRDELNKEFIAQKIDKQYTGVGIHLTGYEIINGNKIPELFLISNFTDPTYTTIGDLFVSRQLFNTMPNEFKTGNENLCQTDKQLIVKEFLRQGKMFIFNNGDPEMFNSLSNAYKEAMTISKNRKVIKDSNDIEI